MGRKLLVYALMLATVSALERKLDGPVSVASVDVQPDVKVPVLRTYRNAYGTHFDASSTWKMLLGVYVLFVVGGFLLLSVIPVRFANEKSEAPFVFWFGSTEKKQDVEEKVETQSRWRRALSWISSFFLSDSTAYIDVRYRSQSNMTQQLAAATTKTYESVARSTEDLEAPESPPKAKPQQKPPSPSRGPSRSSLFKAAPPSPSSVGRMRLASDASKAESVGRRSRANSNARGAATKEDFVRAASERQAIAAAQAERRATLAKADVSYENVADDEMQVYEYLEFVRELLDGLALKKICQKSGRVVSRKLHITADMQVVFWNSIGAMKRQTAKSSLRTELIDNVQMGLRGSAKATSKSTPHREAHCVSIHSSDGKWLILEAKTKAMMQRLFLGFTRLSHEKYGSEAAAAPQQPTLREDAGAKERLVGMQVKKMSLGKGTKSPRSQGQLISTANLDGKLNEEVLAEILEYEEKPPPPQEQVSFQQKLFSTRTHLRTSMADDAVYVGSLGARSFKRPEGDGNKQVAEEAELLINMENLLAENEDVKHPAETAPRDIPSDADGVDIDNLSDDPELSRE